MRVLVCGSRHFGPETYPDPEGAYELMYETLHEILGYYDNKKDNVIIHGGARGADTLAGRYGKDFDVPVIVFPANWGKHGKAAGPIRNKQMLDEGKPDLVIAFLAPDSRGTKNMIEQATKAGVPVKVINI